MKRRRYAGLLRCLLLLAATLCSCKSTPDNAKDLLSKAYKNMTDVKSYRMNSKLVMNTSMSGKESKTTIETTTGMAMEPFELTIAYRGQTDDKEPVSTYMYIKPGDAYATYYYENGQWKKTTIEKDQVEELKKEYASPLDFGVYFNEVDSFTITSSDDNEMVMEGTVSSANMVNVLKKTGVLKQLSLTTFPEEQLKEARPIKVKAWAGKKTLCMEKVSIDMTDTYQDLANLMFGEESTVCPKINQCLMEMSNIVIDGEYQVELPADVKKALEQLR